MVSDQQHKRRIFIADAHLRQPDDGNYRLLLEFLDSIKGDTDTLFILGDLFEFWIGYRDMPYRHYKQILDKLTELTHNGIHIVFFEGNHDFHMGPWFENTLRAEIHPGPALLEIDGKRAYLCHGDQIITKDIAYKLLRLIFHSNFTRVLAQIVPKAIPMYIADTMGRKSKKSHSVRKQKWDYRAIFEKFAWEKFAEGYDVVIGAHFHTPFAEHVNGKTMVSLGDWITQFSYGEWENGTISLKTFSVSQPSSSPKSA